VLSDRVEVVDAKTVARVVRAARTEAGLTQAALAERLGTKQSVVSRWERGHEEPRVSTLVRVMQACGLSLSIAVEHDVVEHDDVDRAQIRQQLAMTPEQRLASVVNLSRTLASAKRAD
jgi:transcriptional regulator with XRE-family HTH domain